jgi:hypothetical protein
MPNELMAILARRRKTIDDAAQAGILSLELAPPPAVITPSEAPKSWTKNILKVKRPSSPREVFKSPRAPRTGSPRWGRSPKPVKATAAAAAKAPAPDAAASAAVVHSNGTAAAAAEAEQPHCNELLQQLSALQPSFALPALLFEQACTLCRSAVLLAVAERAHGRLLTVLRAAGAMRSGDVTRQQVLCAIQLQQSAELSAALWEALLTATLSSPITENTNNSSSSSSGSSDSQTAANSVSSAATLAPEELRRVTVLSAMSELAAVIGQLQLPASVLTTLAAFAAQHYSVRVSLDDVYSPLPAQTLLWLLQAHCSSYISSNDKSGISNSSTSSGSGTALTAGSSNVAASSSSSSSSSSSASHQQSSIDARLSVGAPLHELVKRAVQHPSSSNR